MKILLSFDIDGTLETGDPPGPVTLDMVRKAKELGCLIGSASDRSITTQKQMWERHNIIVDFTSGKHVLIDVKERFEADYYLHMGDRELDRQFALEAGFNFMWMTDAVNQPWIAMLNGGTPQASTVPEGASDTAVLETEPETSKTAEATQTDASANPHVFSTTHCQGTEQDPNWCAVHHQPLWECAEVEEDLWTLHREIKG